MKLPMNKLEAIIVCAVLGLILLMGISTCAKADTWVSATVWSYHTDRTVDRNEKPYGLGVEHDVDWFGLDHARVVAGFYKNSDWKQTEYVGLTYMPWKVGPARVGAMFGLVTGYADHVLPAIVPTISFEDKKEMYGANIGVLPMKTDNGYGLVVGLQLKAKFK
jgi:hypothetical protein